MCYDITIKRGDTKNCIKAILKDADGTPVNLTGCDVKFYMAPLDQSITINRAADIQDAIAGEVWIEWLSGETDVVGVYRAEFKVAHLDGKTETFPNSGYISIQMLNDLG